MTVTAVDTVIADVMFMTELNWLLSFDPLTGIPRRAVKFNGYPQERNSNKKRAIDCDFRQCVSAVVKNLWHRRRINREL